MTKISRRVAVRSAAGLAGAAATGAGAAPAAATPADGARTKGHVEERTDAGARGSGGGPGRWTAAELRDRRRVLRLGFTEEEADCWLLVARAGAAFFALPQTHPSDTPDVADAVHVVQRILMQRPAYKKYRKMGEEEEPPPPVR
ncbi:hypothetical protein AB0D04_04330 [Streptomyces sp. NPDC048483]|uniref:hypothetical protein n=1 Tax=Streptomyces sp. NPDC048483 TaxID=3154927 RepID=UPI0034192AF7